MATAKSFTDLANLYTQKVLVTESAAPGVKAEDTEKKKVVAESKVPSDKVGAKQDIGEAKLEKKGGDEKVKKDLDKPTEEKKDDSGKPETLKESKTKSLSLFDQVYNQIVNEEFGNEDEEEDDLDDTPAAPAPEGGEGDVPPAEGGEEEVIDPAASFALICAEVEKLKQHFGIASEEEVVEAPLNSDPVPPVGEATEMKELPDSAGKKLQGKNNKVEGATKVNGKGKAEATVTVGDGKLQKAPDAEKKFSGKDNKVKGSGPAVKGGGASALED